MRIIRGIRKFWATALAGCGCLFAIIPETPAQSWTPTLAPSMDWISLASSADGSRLLAASYTALLLSTNAGVTWTTNNVPSHAWACVASSADGNELLAGEGFTGAGLIYFSTNGGAIWTTSSVPIKTWSSLAMSADGTEAMALSSTTGSPLYVSTNSGATWTTNAFSASFVESVVSSLNGNQWEVVQPVLNGGVLLISTNFGVSWTSNYINATLLDSPHMAASADGSTIVVGQAGNGGYIYTSTNSGVSWYTNSVHRVWGSVAASADGRRMIAVSYPSIYTSPDSGMTWVSNNAPGLSWSAAASSADGNVLYAAAYPGGIYTLRTTPAPSLNLSLTPANGSAGLSWTIPSTNFVLQQSPDLANWSGVTNASTLNPTNLQNQVTVPLTNNEGFYRLTTP